MTDRPEIAALLVSLPERGALLTEAIRSVYLQDRQPDHLLVGVDYGRVGEAENMNRLIDAAVDSCRRPRDLWLAFLHDDDLWRHDHLARAEEAITHRPDLDVVVSRFRVIGPRPPIPWHDDWATLRYTNWFPPSAVVVRADTFGRWTPAEPPPPDAWPGAGTWLDWSNWRRLLAAGARFATTGNETMAYRFGDWTNGSWSAGS